MVMRIEQAPTSRTVPRTEEAVVCEMIDAALLAAPVSLGPWWDDRKSQDWYRGLAAYFGGVLASREVR